MQLFTHIHHHAIAIVAACGMVNIVQSFFHPPPTFVSHHRNHDVLAKHRSNTIPSLSSHYLNNDDNNGVNDHNAEQQSSSPSSSPHTHYGMGGQDLSKRWIELVSEGHIVAATELKSDSHEECDDDDKGLHVRYGVRLERTQPMKPGKPYQTQQQQRLLEFVEILPASQEEEEGGTSSPSSSSKLRDRILSINATLTEMQQSSDDEASSSSSSIVGNSSSSSSSRNSNVNDYGRRQAIQCVYDGPYAAQLQLVRTLRPPRSKDMSVDATTTASKDNNDQKQRASCQPPPYDPSSDSFLVGPLRLYGQCGEFHGDGHPRVRAARMLVPGGNDDDNDDDGAIVRHWDVFHNISPVDPRGHYLLLPALDNTKEWRDQSLIPKDCHDVTYLASTINPPGSMVLCFNSVGAGASQNHIHCHAWVCPPPLLLCRDEGEYGIASDDGFCSYAVSKASELMKTSSVMHLGNGLTVSLLDYPCTCIKLSTTTWMDDDPDLKNNMTIPPGLKEMGDALSIAVGIAQKMSVPHNVAWTNHATKDGTDDASNNSQSKTAVVVDAYVFFRKAETSSILNDVGGVFRLGASEMLGVFHSSSMEQLESLLDSMGSVLSDVSWEPHEAVWRDFCEALQI